MTELKGFEEAKGATRPKGVEHGASQDRKSWLERKTQEEADLGYKTQPYCVIVGGGQGGIALGARLKRLGVPTIIVEKNPRAGDSWRNRYTLAVPARPGVVRPPAVPAVPRPLAGVRAEGQDRRLARDVHQGDGAELLDAERVRRAPALTKRSRSGRSASTATARPWCCGRSSWCWPRACRASPTCRRSPARRASRATSTTPASTRAARSLPRQEVRGHRLQQLGARHLRRPVGTRRRRDDAAALEHAHRALRHADGTGARRAVLRRGGEVRRRPPTRPT